jgi:hypothetical protein
MLRERREVFDYVNQIYVDVFKDGKCVLWCGFDKIKEFDNFDDAYDYWCKNYEWR